MMNRQPRALLTVLLCSVAASLASLAVAGTDSGVAPPKSRVISLDGTWSLATDPKNVGLAEKWPESPLTDVKPTKVPGILQDTFPGYHGVVWYEREFIAPKHPDPQGRYLVRFWNADYKADVWVNGISIGGHEGADGVFVLDATAAVKPDISNRLTVRLLNPKDEPIDGILLKETPHRNKTCEFTFGNDYNHGGLEDSVDLIVAPAVRIEDLFVRADWKTGIIHVRANVRNTLAEAAHVYIELSTAPAASGEVLATASRDRAVPPGDTVIETDIALDHPRLWQLHDPCLYRVTAKVRSDGLGRVDEQSTRCGFRDFRVENGFFRLNGKRLFLKCTHTGNDSMIGCHVCYDRDFFRRDLLNLKVMGFNSVRFIAGCATPWQLDLCDEIGLMVYEEPYSAWLLANSPKMKERFDRSTAEMIRRDRNHPSVTMWGLLNETEDGPVFRHAVAALPAVRALDDSRLVVLNSGRFDRELGIGSVSNPGSAAWECLMGDERAGAGKSPGKMICPTTEGLGDFHLYPQVPHSAETMRLIRTLGQGTKPIFLSEYGIGSAVDLTLVVRNFEQRGADKVNAGAYYRQALDKFLVDWEKWRMADVFGRPEDYFEKCVAAMADQRLLGINAIRSNPTMNGYSVTGAIDHGYSGEGLTRAFREMKTGTVDAIFDGFAPLRWCLFAEPVNLYRGKPVQLDAVLANEDVLPPGNYPVRIEVFGPQSQKVFERKRNIAVPDSHGKPEPAMAMPVFSEAVAADWPAGKYRLTATFEYGGAAAGRAAEFYVADPAELPKVDAEIALWGEDVDLARWLQDHGVRTQPLASAQTAREVILVSAKPAGDARAWSELAQHIARGSTAVFLSSHVFAKGNDRTGWLPLANKGRIDNLSSWLYHKDEWTRQHPIFEGLPCGGLMDYTFYRDIIGPRGFAGQDTPAEVVAGANFSCPAYASGLLTSVNRLGTGQFILNTLNIRENLGRHPAADRLLLNMLRYATRDAKEPLADLPADFDQQLKTMGYDPAK